MTLTLTVFHLLLRALVNGTAFLWNPICTYLKKTKEYDQVLNFFAMDVHLFSKVFLEESVIDFFLNIKYEPSLLYIQVQKYYAFTWML